MASTTLVAAPTVATEARSSLSMTDFTPPSDSGRDDPPGPPTGPDRTPPTEPHPWGQAPRTRMG
ncbi:MAG: hypothetical protein OEV40_22410, partial [Acidimicrobiia bacterium]|nr:hypothetical protein [Acidimicrobiia bacterium]